MAVQSPQKNLFDTVWKILLIDGDEDDFILIRDMLKEAKGRRIEVLWASSYEMGQSKLAVDHYDAVLMDNDLGAPTGIDLIRALNERGFTAPLILFTGRGSYEEDIEAMRAGATLYMSKNDLNALSLERFIRYAIERKQAETSIKESEEKFAKAFRASPAAQFIIRQSDGVIVDLNESFEKLLGYNRGELIGHTTIESNLYLNQQDRDVILRILKNEGRVSNREVVLQNKAGSSVSIIGSIEIINIGGEVYFLSTMIDITERKQSEAALRESEEKYRTFFENLRESMVLFEAMRDEQGNLIDLVARDANPPALAATGLPREDMLGRRAGELFPIEALERALIHLPRMFETGEPWTDEQMFNGRHFRYTVFRMTNNMIAVSTEDITERNRAETALRESEEKYRALFENSTEAIFLTRPDGSIQAANPAASNIFGWSEEELIRLGRAGIQDTEDPRLAEALEIRKQTGRVQAQEFIGIRKGGERFPIEVDSVVLEGEPKRSFVIVRDITERKQAEKKLQENEKRERNRAHELEAILDAVPAYIFITHDPDSRTMTANRATQELLRSKPGDNISKSAPEPEIPRQFRAMRDGKEIPNDELPVQLAAAKCMHVEDYEFDVVFEDGSSRRLMGNAAPLCDEHGDPSGAVGAFIDITELRRIEQETSERTALMEVQRRLLEHREMERMQIARDLHDGPIQSLGGLNFSLQMLKSTVESWHAPHAEDAMEMIEQLKQDVHDLVGELRGVCNELRPPLLERFGFRKAVEAHVEGFQARHPEIKIALDMTEKPNKVSENIATALFRIYQEALNNVVRHSEATEISIHFDFDPQQILLEIQDNGKGFPLKSDWVEIVRQGHFGLVGMKERAEAIRGDFQAQSSPGKGTVIRVTVPTSI